MSDDWSIEIVHPWYVGPSRDGSGFALMVHRGIPCEGHTQATSAHDDGQINPETARESMAAVVEEYRDTIKKAIDGFVEMQHGLSGLRRFGIHESAALRLDGAAEAIGNAFQAALIRFLVAETTSLEYEKSKAETVRRREADDGQPRGIRLDDELWNRRS